MGITMVKVCKKVQFPTLKDSIIFRSALRIDKHRVNRVKYTWMV